MKSYFKPISILTSGKLHSKPINPLKISQKAQFLRFTTSTKEIQLNQIESSEQKEKFLEIKWKDSHISKVIYFFLFTLKFELLKSFIIFGLEIIVHAINANQILVKNWLALQTFSLISQTSILCKFF